MNHGWNKPMLTLQESWPGQHIGTWKNNLASPQVHIDTQRGLVSTESFPSSYPGVEVYYTELCTNSPLYQGRSKVCMTEELKDAARVHEPRESSALWWAIRSSGSSLVSDQHPIQEPHDSRITISFLSLSKLFQQRKPWKSWWPRGSVMIFNNRATVDGAHGKSGWSPL